MTLMHNEKRGASVQPASHMQRRVGDGGMSDIQVVMRVGLAYDGSDVA